MCNCGAPPTPAKRPPPTDEMLVRCTNCSGPLVTLHGATVPVHLIEILASPAQILAWEVNGYTFTKRAP